MVSTTVLVGWITVAVLVTLLVRLLAWSVVRRAAARAPDWGMRLAASPIWVAGAPWRARVAAGYPRLYGGLAGRFSTVGFTGLPLTLVVVAAVVAAAALGGLVDDVLGNEGLAHLDQRVDAFFAPYRASWLLNAFLWVTAISAGPSLTAMVCCTTALLWSGGRGRLVVPVWVTFLGAQVTTWSSKYLIDRPRPAFLPGITEWNPSFPSGHATASTALIGIIGFVVAVGRPGLGSRFEVTFWTAVAILVICFSRIFLGVHFLTDVLAGILVGTFWLLVGATVAVLWPSRPNTGV